MFSGLIQELWAEWELPGMVILSLLLQFVLLVFGNRRRYQGRASPYIAILVWSTYLAADWVATVALSALLKAKEDKLHNKLFVFWTPFLLLHLGGPHTISAYALTDNELWLRYFLGLVIQVGVAIYVYVKFRTNSTLTYTAIPIFIAGIIKYGERIWILKAASHKQFSSSVFSSPSPATAKSLDHIQFNGSTSSNDPHTLDEYLTHKNVIGESKYIHRAFYLFKMHTPLFSELRLRIYRDLSENFMLPLSMSAEDAFKVVQTELGFLYDVLYTKAASLQSIVGIILRGICLLSTFAALVAFSIVVGKSGYPIFDISITYLLLGGEILLDIYSVILHTLSDWTMLRLTNPSNLVHKFVGRTIVFRVVHSKAKEKGSVSMAQHSLIDYCLKTSRWTKILRVLDTEDILGKFWLTSWKQVNPNLKNFIHLHLQKKFKRYRNKENDKKIEEMYEEFDHELLSVILKERGDHVLQIKGIKEEFKWTINDLELGHSILMWHIATFLLFYDDHKRYSGSVLGSYCKISKLLSDYMMYLLLVRPLMLPKGIGQVRITDTREEVIRFFGPEKSLTNNDAAAALLHFNSEFSLSSSIHSKSVLRDGCKLASKLNGLVEESYWDLEEKWEMIAEVWMEMLAYAASKCRWKHHATHLRHGGELLTHVALLMAHLGLTEHIRIVHSISDGGLSSPSHQSLRWDWDHLSHLSYYLA